MMTHDDQERFRRIRDKQLQARDPLTKQRKQDQHIARKQRKYTKSFSFTAMLDEMPARWLGLTIGLMVGGFTVLVMPSFFSVAWLDYATIGGTLFLMLLGFSVGRAVDMKDNIHDLL